MYIGNDIENILDPNWQFDHFIEHIKRQETIAIQAILSVKRADIYDSSLALATYLEEHAQNMKEYISKTYAANIIDGFEGETAKQAVEYLEHHIMKPYLKSPIRG